jgi:ubiquinone/menaquinone biosynthesis C-methylase UbiE
MSSQVPQQRDYYARTAEHYDSMHIADDDEHGIAIAAFIGIARLKGATSVLDVGAGTGRALHRLREGLSDARLVGVEPVAELRAVGHLKGVPHDQLIEGDATALPFGDDEFDFVIETGVLHHVREPAKAVAEMMRVARLGVMISDANKFGQGSPITRRFKAAIRRLGLWSTLIRIQTRGKMSKWSEGDGLYYSYSVYDNIGQLPGKFPKILTMNTTPISGTDPRSGASQVMVLALKA